MSIANFAFSQPGLADLDLQETETKQQKAKAGGSKKQTTFVHISQQQRTGKKSLTLVQGLAEDLDLRKILKVLRKMYSTNGAILKSDEHGEVIQLQGDFRRDVCDFLVKYNICDRETIKIHGA